MGIEKLPTFIKQTEAELQKRGGWQPILPCLEDPSRYQDLQETCRYNNVLLARYFDNKFGMSPAAGEAPQGNGRGVAQFSRGATR